MKPQQHEDTDKEDAIINPYIPKYIAKAPCMTCDFYMLRVYWW